MPNRQFVRICPVNSVESIDLELPADQPIRLILPDLLKVLDQPVLSGKKRLHYCLKNEEDELLSEEQTFAEAGIENFQTLWLTVLTNKTGGVENNDPEKTVLIKYDATVDAKSLPVSDLPRGLQGVMSPALWSQLPIENPSLVNPSGMIFELGDPPLSIGRYSKDCHPQIDLTELDNEAISSRRHAEISVANGKYILKALKTTNGTFVNGNKLNPQDAVALKDGDTIMFGLRGVKLIFCLPKK